jgi:hypothetical protein
MKFNLTVFLLIATLNSAFSQKFNPDKNGYVSDKAFPAHIKQRNYQLVSAFELVEKDSVKVLLSTAIKDNKTYHLDLSGNELPYYDENANRIIRREKLLNKPYEILKKRYKDLNFKLDPQYKLFSKDNKYGLLSANNDKIVVDAKYDGVWAYGGMDLILIQQNKLAGIIDTLGVPIIKMEYTTLVPCVIDTLAVKFFVGYRNSLATLVTLKGKELFPPKYNSISAFSADGVLITTLIDENKNELKGLLNRNGEVIVEPKYSEFTSIPNSDLVRTHLNGSSQVGLINRDGKIILDVSYDFISISPDDRLILIMKDGKTGYLDRLGNIVVPPIYKKVIIVDDKDFVIVANEMPAEAGKISKFGILTAGNQLVPLEYDNIFAFDDFFIGKKAGVYYKLSNTGKVLKNYDYQDMNIVEKHFIIAKNKEGNFGVLTTKERTVIPFVYTEIKNVGLYFATNKGIVDIDNNVVLPKTWQKLTWTNDLALRKKGIFAVEANGLSIGVLCLDRYGNSYNTKNLLR